MKYILTFIWIIVVLLALLVGYIPISYIMYGVNEGYLELKSQLVLGSQIWWTFLYIHIITGGIVISIGWIQFNNFIQKKFPKLHKTIGKIYLIFALPCAISGIYVGFYATGGWMAAIGFITVGILYFTTTWKGYKYILQKNISQHQNMMTYSYALCLAAVSLRLLVPISHLMGIEYNLAYTLIAWFAWIPNLAIAYWINNRRISTLNSISLT